MTLASDILQVVWYGVVGMLIERLLDILVLATADTLLMPSPFRGLLIRFSPVFLDNHLLLNYYQYCLGILGGLSGLLCDFTHYTRKGFEQRCNRA